MSDEAEMVRAKAAQARSGITDEQIDAVNGQLFEAMDAVRKVADATGYPRLADNVDLVEDLMDTIHSALADLWEGPMLEYPPGVTPVVKQ